MRRFQDSSHSGLPQYCSCWYFMCGPASMVTGLPEQNFSSLSGGVMMGNPLARATSTLPSMRGQPAVPAAAGHSQRVVPSPPGPRPLPDQAVLCRLRAYCCRSAMASAWASKASFGAPLPGRGSRHRDWGGWQCGVPARMTAPS